MRIKKVKVRTESRHGDDEPILMVDEDGVWETVMSDMKCVQPGGSKTADGDGTGDTVTDSDAQESDAQESDTQESDADGDASYGIVLPGREERIRYGTTAMTVREDEVIIDGEGELRSHIVLRPDGRVYETSFESADIGSLVMGIRTHYLRTERMDDGLVIEIGYDLTHQKRLVNKVEIVITVTGAEA